MREMTAMMLRYPQDVKRHNTKQSTSYMQQTQLTILDGDLVGTSVVGFRGAFEGDELVGLEVGCEKDVYDEKKIGEE